MEKEKVYAFVEYRRGPQEPRVYWIPAGVDERAWVQDHVTRHGIHGWLVRVEAVASVSYTAHLLENPGG